MIGTDSATSVSSPGADRTVRIDQTAGRVRVLLPRETTVRVKAEVGLGNVTLLRPSRQSAASLDEDLRKKWVTDGVPLEGSPVEQSIVGSLNSLPYWYLQPVTAKSSEGVGKSVGYTLDRASAHVLTLDMSMGAGVVEIIDPYWTSDGWKPVVPTQLCTVGGGPAGVVESCDAFEITKRVALCINDNGYLVDCREDRPATIDNPRVPACRDFSGEYIDCSSVGIEPINAQLVSPTEPSAEGESPKPTIAMPDPSSTETTNVPGTTGD